MQKGTIRRDGSFLQCRQMTEQLPRGVFYSGGKPPS